jgi:RNA recognition motif-containing protein
MIYNLSNTVPNNYQSNIYNYNNQNIQKTKEPSNTFLLSNLGPDINNEILEDIFREKCLEAETSMPEDIRFIESLNLAYIIFPSISVAMKLYEKLNGKIIINGSPYNLSYTPNTQQINNNRESITYVTHLIDNNSYTTSMETTVHEDWYCEYCDCKNFSRRVACFKCKRPKTLNCRIAPVIKQKTTIVGENGKIPPSTSLMVRGDSIKDSNEGEVSLIIFNQKLIYKNKYIYFHIYVYI